MKPMCLLKWTFALGLLAIVLPAKEVWWHCYKARPKLTTVPQGRAPGYVLEQVTPTVPQPRSWVEAHWPSVFRRLL